MPIPDLDNYGLLPAGIFDCTLNEISSKFCSNAHRQNLYQDLLRFLKIEWSPLGIHVPIYIDGSFVRSKPMPDDIDLLVDLTSQSNALVAQVFENLWLQRPHIRKNYNIDFWFRHPLIDNDFVTFFQYIGDKAAAELSLQPKYQKGILRLGS